MTDMDYRPPSSVFEVTGVAATVAARAGYLIAYILYGAAILFDLLEKHIRPLRRPQREP